MYCSIVSLCCPFINTSLVPPSFLHDWFSYDSHLSWLIIKNLTVNIFGWKPQNNSSRTGLVTARVNHCWEVIAVWRHADCSPCERNNVPLMSTRCWFALELYFICCWAEINIFLGTTFLATAPAEARRTVIITERIFKISWVTKLYALIDIWYMVQRYVMWQDEGICQFVWGIRHTWDHFVMLRQDSFNIVKLCLQKWLTSGIIYSGKFQRRTKNFLLNSTITVSVHDAMQPHECDMALHLLCIQRHNIEQNNVHFLAPCLNMQSKDKHSSKIRWNSLRKSGYSKKLFNHNTNPGMNLTANTDYI